MRAADESSGASCWDSSPYSITAVPPQMLRYEWPTVREGIERAIRGTRSNIAGIRFQLGTEALLLWIIRRRSDDEVVGHLITQELTDNSTRALRVVSVGGVAGKEWVPLLHSFLIKQVRAGHYDTLLASCRPGMMRWLSRLGWRVQRYEMECR